ncbi:MAG: hypothetical protein HQL55_13560, partial [Magnetococcales bacterium]|nr:hypothetical protein [Magnetococcales bacterium]
ADSAGQGVYAKIYDSDGAVQKESFLVNTTLAGNQRYASVSSLPYGGFVITWASQAGSSPSDYNICGQRFTASGAEDGGEFVVNATTSSVQDRPVVASHGTGFLVLWQSLDQDGDNYGIFGQRYGLNDPPVLDNSAIFYPGSGIQGLPVEFSIDRLLGNSVTDEDQGAVEGIAITGLDSSNGTWYYSLDGGANWQAIDGASNTSALLLAAGGGSKLRFVADEFSFVGTAEFNFKAWDQNFGANGQRVNLNSDDARISTSVAIGLARVRVEPLPPPIQTSDREQVGVGDREDSNQTSTSLAQFIQSLVQAGQVQVSTLSQEQLMRMYQEFLARNGLNAEGIIVSTDGEGATKTADGANQEAALGQALAAGTRGEGGHVGDAQGGKRGDMAALGATLSKQLEGQTHRTEAERQELAKVLHEIQGLLNCN